LVKKKKWDDPGHCLDTMADTVDELPIILTDCDWSQSKEGLTDDILDGLIEDT